MKTNKKLVQVDGSNLIIGKTYYLDKHRIDEGVYEGILEEGNVRRCLFTPIGETTYLPYGISHYNGKYVGKFSLGLWAYFFEEQV
jgi:hypothetical protein